MALSCMPPVSALKHDGKNIRFAVEKSRLSRTVEGNVVMYFYKKCYVSIRTILDALLFARVCIVDLYEVCVDAPMDGVSLYGWWWSA